MNDRRRLEIQRALSTRSRSVQAIIQSKRAEPSFMRGRAHLLTDKLSDGAWRGSRCFLIGGGPSLIGFDFNRLRGEHIITINRAIEYTPFADLFYSMDWSFYRNLNRLRYGEQLFRAYQSFGGIRCWLNLGNYGYGPEVYALRGLHSELFPTNLQKGIYSGTNSGYGALMIALCLGASPIYLLGYDLKSKANRSHFHSGYFIKGAGNEARMQRFKKHFEKIAPKIIAHGDRIINLNADSSLRCFEFGSIDEVLDEHINARPESSRSEFREIGSSGAIDRAADL
jgi:hypothetical protein